VKRRIFVIGIDGTSPDLLDWMFDQELLPNLQKIRRHGVSGTLMSTRHPITPAAWTSMITGVGPGIHGLFDFRRRIPGSFDSALLCGRDRDGETIWNILSDAGHVIGLFNVPMTYPPEKVRGFWISGMDTPWKRRDYAFPSSLVDWLDEQTGGYVVDVGQGTSTNTEKEYLENVLELQRLHRSAFESLLHRYQPEVYMGVFVATDRLQHAFWKYVDPENGASASPEAAMYREGLIECYQSIDDILGMILKEYVDQEGAFLIVVSDHGFGPLHKDVYLNQWLMEKGYLNLKQVHPDWENTSLFGHIDWEQTIAYSFGYFGNLYLNLQGREPLGTVSPGLKQRQTLDRIKRDLEAWQLPDGDGPLVDGLYEVRDLYSGPYVEWGPDLLVTMQNYAYMTRDSFDVPRGVLFSDPMAYQSIPIKHSGNHRMEGIVFMIGDGIAESKHLSKACVLDIAPTVLHLMGQPIPNYMDGRVLTEALRSDVQDVKYSRKRRDTKAPTLHRTLCQVRSLEQKVNRLQVSLDKLLAYQNHVRSHWAVRTWRKLQSAYSHLAQRVTRKRII
jgi:predicted AlkP superfamily phosphohydrolase/phosphomutase